MLKNYFLLFIGLMLLPGWKNSVQKIAGKASAANVTQLKNHKELKSKPDYGDPLRTDYTSFLLKLDTSQLESPGRAAAEFTVHFKGKSQSVYDSRHT